MGETDNESTRCRPDTRQYVAASSGTGKSHIALGLGLAACQKGLSVGFTTAISTRVNKPENDDPPIVEPIELTTDAA